MRRLLPWLALLAACSSDSGPLLADAATDAKPPLSSATSLHCPAPGALPFEVTSTFVKATNATLVADNPRNKDEASDTLGSPSGIVASVTASIYLPDDQQPTTTGIAYRGVKARTTPTSGLSAKPITGETVSLWTYDTENKAWQALGMATTGLDGDYDVPAAGNAVPNGQPVYAVLEADGSCTEHYNYLLPAGSKVVVFDIDGTLTLSDGELLMELADGAYVPKLMGAADKLVQAWATKGYTVVYLTARPHDLRAETRGWLTALGFPGGPMITENGAKADVYKTLWLNRMIQSFGWNVVAAYGNADTDITAYANAAIPKAQTFIVGPLAGMGMTQPIANMDFTDHIATYVAAQPANP
jgi:LNS2 (Lipin/Ned1/Smp2)